MTGQGWWIGWLMLGIVLWASAWGAAAPLQVAPPASQARTVVTLKIEGWTCASCEKDIRRALLAVPGVTQAEVSYVRGGAVVEVEPDRVTLEQLVQAVASAGNILSSYRAVVVPNGTLAAEGTEAGGVEQWLRKLLR